jgi:parallel beta-helix repeat protein
VAGGKVELLRRNVFGMLLLLLLTSPFVLAFNIQPVKAEGTIYIRANGSIDPPIAPISTVDNITYTFTGNIYDSIVVERDNIVIDGAGYMVQGAGSGTGIDLLSRTNVTVRNAEVTAFVYGISLDGSSNTISGNNITYIDYGGILLDDMASGNLIYANYIARCQYGIYVWGSSGNTILDNDIKDNERGIFLYAYSHLNVISGNILRINDYGVYLQRHVVYGSEPENNRIFHNNFMDNADQVYSDSVSIENFWDNEYPSGGNHWSDYVGADMYNGTYQNETGSDGIGDTSYIIDQNNKDSYPLMNSWISPDFSITVSSTSLIIQQGNEDAIVITITSLEAFDQLVQLSVSGTPLDVIINVNPEHIALSPYGSTNSTLTVSVDATAQLGSYTLNIVGNSSILINGVVIPLVHSVNIQLEITALPPPENQPPIAEAGLDMSVFSGDLVQFNGSNSYDSDGTIVSYQWDFGDGTAAEGKIVSHLFRGAQNEPKTYTVTLTAEDNYGAIATDTASVIVKPLTKRVELSPTYLGTPYMEATYNWVGTDVATGEDLYVISRIDTCFGGIAGASQFFIVRRTHPSPSIPKVIWHIPLPTEWRFNTRTYTTPFTPSTWQKLWGTTCDPDSIYYTKLIFPDGTFEGIGVTKTSFMFMVATGAEISIIQAYWDAGWARFDPNSPASSIKQEQLEGMEELSDALGLLNDLIDVMYSPAELRVHDSQGHVTGLVNGEKKEEIPGSTYVNDTVIILYPNETYSHQVVGLENGNYSLLTIYVKNGIITTFKATSIPISTGAIHQYSIDWVSLREGKKGADVCVDINGDNAFEWNFTADNELTREEFLKGTSSVEGFPLWIVGTAVGVTLIAVAVGVLLRKRKKP